MIVDGIFGTPYEYRLQSLERRIFDHVMAMGYIANVAFVTGSIFTIRIERRLSRGWWPSRHGKELRTRSEAVARNDTGSSLPG